MPFLPPEPLHFRTASRRQNITEHGARLFNVSPEQFSSWLWQMKLQVNSGAELEGILDISESERAGFAELKDRFHAGVTPYYIALMLAGQANDPVRIQALPVMAELNDVVGVADPLQEISNSPVKEVVHVYPDRVAFCVAQLCPVYCRYCFRKRRDDEVGLHFNPRIIDAGVAYIANNPKIRDVLVTGGDPLIAHNKSLYDVLSKLRAIPHVEILRIGTRVPVTLPYRITEELADLLATFHPLWINTHFNCAEEITPEATRAIDTLLRRGIPVGNQSVLLKGVNDSVEQLKALFEGLIRIRVRPYYLYQAQIVEGTAHLRVPIEKGLDLMRALRGTTTGFALPQYILDTPTGKVPLTPQNIIGRDGDGIVVEQLNGEPWTEPNPLGGYRPARSLPQIGEKIL